MKGSARVTTEGASEEPATEAFNVYATPSDAPEEATGKKPAPPAAPKMTQPMRDIRIGEDQALKDYLDSLGPDGSIRVRIVRESPKTLRVNGRDYSTAGHLATVSECVDEEYLSNEFGGGTYALTITSRRKAEGGSFRYAGHRQIVVAGDPKIEKLPANATQTPAPVIAAAAPSESPFAKEVVGILRSELEHARDKPAGIDPAMQALIDQLREDARRRDEDIRALQRSLSDAQNKKPPEDTFKDKLLGSLVDGESARIVSVRAQHESEIRTLKEGQIQEIRLIEDRHDRAMQQAQRSFDLLLANLKAGYEREIAAINASHQVASVAATTTSSVTTTTLNADIKRLEREVDSLRADNKELRERKDKTVFEQIKEMKTLKEAFGGDEEKDDSMAEKVIAAVPAAIESIGGLIDRRRATQPAQQAQAQAAQAQRPRIVANPKTGERFVQKNGQLTPVKAKPKHILTDAGEQVEIPKIEPTTLTLIISQLEAAFGRNEAPEIVAQTGRSSIPTDILAWIRERHTEQVSGVDLFMTKVAKLPGSSPLASQAGKNWLRAVGALLVGE